MLKKTNLLLILIFIAGELFSHPKDSITYKNGFAINAEALFVEDFKLTFSHKLFKKLYFESMASYNLPLPSFLQNFLLNNDVYLNEGDSPRDPFYYYGRFQIRAGLKEYLTRKFYLGEMLLYNYGHFNNEVVYDEDIVSRVKQDYEILLKCGWTYNHKSLLLDFYLGIGYRYKHLDDTDTANVLVLSNVVLSNCTFNQSTSYQMFQVHCGLQIGFCK